MILGVASSNASIGNYHGLKKIHMPLTFQQDKGISSYIKRLMARNVNRNFIKPAYLIITR